MKKVIIFIFIFVCLLFWQLPVYAQENQTDISRSEEYEQMVEDLTGDMKDAAGDDVNEILREQEISLESPEKISDISAGEIINGIYNSFMDVLKRPVVMLGKIIAITLLCVTAKSMAPEGSSLTKAFNIIGVLSTVAVMYETVYSGIEIIQSSLQRLSEFMTAYIPVFSSVAAVGGSVTVSGSYYALTFMLCEIIGVAAKSVIMPFLSIVLSISVVSAINPELQFSGAAELIKKACHWILGGMMTIFVGLLSIQGISGSAADTLSSRTLKFAASSFIPVIGGAVSEAYSTIRSSMGIIRTGIGTIGIIIICVMILKPILTIIAIKLIISIAQIISGFFDQKECMEFLKSTNAVMSIGLSVIICFCVIFIIATAVLMMTAMNIGV